MNAAYIKYCTPTCSSASPPEWVALGGRLLWRQTWKKRSIPKCLDSVTQDAAKSIRISVFTHEKWSGGQKPNGQEDKGPPNVWWFCECLCVCMCDHATGAWALSKGKWGLGFLPLQKLRLVVCDASTLRFKWLGSYDTNVHNIVLWILSWDRTWQDIEDLC